MLPENILILMRKAVQEGLLVQPSRVACFLYLQHSCLGKHFGAGP